MSPAPWCVEIKPSSQKKNTRRQLAPSVSFYVFARTAADMSNGAQNDVDAKSIDTYPEVNVYMYVR